MILRVTTGKRNRSFGTAITKELRWKADYHEVECGGDTIKFTIEKNCKKQYSYGDVDKTHCC